MSKLSEFIGGGGGAFFDLGDLHVVSVETFTSSGEYTVGAGGDLLYISIAGGAGGGGTSGGGVGSDGGGSQVSIGGSVLTLAKGGSGGMEGYTGSLSQVPAGHLTGTASQAYPPLPPARMELNPLTGVDILAYAGKLVGVNALPIPQGGRGGASSARTYQGNRSGTMTSGGGPGGTPAFGDFLLRVNQGQVFVATVGAGGSGGYKGGDGFVRFILCRE